MLFRPGKVVKVDPVSLNNMPNKYRRLVGSDAKVENMGNGIMRTTTALETDRAYGYQMFYVPSGAAIEVRCLARQGGLPGAGRITIDQNEKNDAIAGNDITWVEPDSTLWKPYTVFAAGRDDKPFIRVTIGNWNNVPGWCEFKDIEFVLYNVENPVIRAACLIINNGDGDVDFGMQGSASPYTPLYVNHGVRAFGKVSESNTRWVVKMDPMQTWWKPVVFLTVEGSPMDSGFDGYTAHPINISRDRVEFFINRIGHYSGSNPLTLTHSEITNLTKNNPMRIHFLAFAV